MKNEPNIPVAGTDIEVAPATAHELDSISTGQPDLTPIEALIPQQAWAGKPENVPPMEALDDDFGKPKWNRLA